MSGEIEFEGRTEQEALQRACAALSLSEAQVDYTVIDTGSGGILGFGSRPVRIRVRPQPKQEGASPAQQAAPAPASPGAEAQSAQSPAPAAKPEREPRERNDRRNRDDDDFGDEEGARGGVVGPAPEKAAKAREVATALSEKMGMKTRITVRDDDAEIVVILEEEEGSTAVAEMLGSSRPRGLPSFQFLLNKIVNRFPEGRKHIVVEAPSIARRPAQQQQPQQPRQQQQRPPRQDGVQQQHAEPVAPQPPPEDVDPELAALAKLLAERATKTGKVITVHPMAAGDRRAIHVTVMSLGGVSTVSEGEGLYRRIHIVPAALRPGHHGHAQQGQGQQGQGQQQQQGEGGRKRRRRRRRRRGPGEGVAAEGAIQEQGGIDEGDDGDVGDDAPDAPEAPAGDASA